MSVSTPAFEASTGDKDNKTVLTTGSFSPTGGDLLIVMASARKVSSSITSITITSTFTGTFVEVGFLTATQTDFHLQVAHLTLGVSPGSGTVTATFDATSTAHSMICFTVNGHNTTTPVKQSKSFETGSGTSTGTLSFDAAITAGNQGIGCIADAGNGDPTNGTGETEIASQSAGSASAGPYCDAQYSTDTDQNWTGLDDRAHIVWLIEIDVAAVEEDDAYGFWWWFKPRQMLDRIMSGILNMEGYLSKASRHRPEVFILRRIRSLLTYRRRGNHLVPPLRITPIITKGS